MDLIGSLGGLSGDLLRYAIPFVFVLTIVVFFHELGHFLVARWCGVAVSVFSVGFGPELVGFNDRHGTRWRLSIIPLGGYVKFLGDEDATSSTSDRDALARMDPQLREHAFVAKAVWQRAAIVAAGPIANFILAIVIFTAMLMAFGRPLMPPRVDAVIAGSAAEEIGLKPGDLIVALDGSHVETFTDLQRVISLRAGTPVRMTVVRGSERFDLTVTPRRAEVKDPFGNVQPTGQLGVTHDAKEDGGTVERFSPPEAVVLAVKESWSVVTQTFTYLHRVIAGRESAAQLSGPVGVARISGQVATLGIVALINLAAVLSISIGLINLFPVPMLDGGHLLFYIFEAVRGRPLSERVQEIGFRIGFALVVMLMLFATWNDVTRLMSL